MNDDDDVSVRLSTQDVLFNLDDLSPRSTLLSASLSLRQRTCRDQENVAVRIWNKTTSAGSRRNHEWPETASAAVAMETLSTCHVEQASVMTELRVAAGMWTV